MIGTWIAIAVAAGALGWIGWHKVLIPFHPPEGAEKLFFVIWCWGTGAAFVWFSFSAHYWLVSALIGLGLLLLGTWTAYGPICRWRQDQIMFKTSSATLPAPKPQRREDDKAA